MNPLLIRRRGMMAAQGGGEWYVNDGLILHLDGINHGSGSDSDWESLVGGHVFTNHGATFGGDCAIFTGSEYFSNTGFDSVSQYAGTVEACFDGVIPSNGNTFVFHPKFSSTNNRKISVSFYNGKLLWICATNSPQVAMYAGVPQKCTLSVNNSACYANGVALITSGSDRWNAANNSNKIGTNSSINAFFIGKIHAIRVYSRKLTTAEMQHNQQIDNARFNLGLNI